MVRRLLALRNCPADLFLNPGWSFYSKGLYNQLMIQILTAPSSGYWLPDWFATLATANVKQGFMGRSWLAVPLRAFLLPRTQLYYTKTIGSVDQERALHERPPPVGRPVRERRRHRRRRLAHEPRCGQLDCQLGGGHSNDNSQLELKLKLKWGGFYTDTGLDGI